MYFAYALAVMRMDKDKKYITEEEKRKILLLLIEKGILTKNQIKMLKNRGSI